MKINIVYKREKEWFVGHIQEYPDYESQGKTLEELRDNLIEIYRHCEGAARSNLLVLGYKILLSFGLHKRLAENREIAALRSQ